MSYEPEVTGADRPDVQAATLPHPGLGPAAALPRLPALAAHQPQVEQQQGTNVDAIGIGIEQQQQAFVARCFALLHGIGQA